MSTTSSIPPRTRVRWSRRKITTWTSAGVLGAGLGAVGLDRGAEIVVERVVASKIQDCLGTPERPDVEISGFPLLPGLARGRLDGLTVTARDADAEGFDVAELRVEARGVEREGAGGEIDSLRGSGLVAYEAISKQAMGMTVSDGGDESIKISGGLGMFSGSATATPRIENGALVVTPGQVSTPMFGSFDVGGFPAIRIPIRELPTGVQVDLKPTERGLEFTFDGTDVRLPDPNPCDIS